MAHGSRICPYCGALNSVGERACHRCKRRFPGPVAQALVDGWRAALGSDSPVTKLYLGLCVGVFVLCAIGAPRFQPPFGAIPLSEILRWGGLATHLAADEPWRYLSAVFVHGNLLHVGFNMMWLWYAGRGTEQRIGSARFTLIFVGSGIAGFIASGWWSALQGQPTFTSGASGGIFGLLGALIGYLYARRDPAYKQVLLMIVLMAVISALAFPADNAAHIGGGVAGAPLGYLFYKEARPWRRSRLLGWVAGALVIASFVSILLSQRSPLWQLRRQIELERAVGAASAAGCGALGAVSRLGFRTRQGAAAPASGPAWTGCRRGPSRRRPLVRGEHDRRDQTDLS